MTTSPEGLTEEATSDAWSHYSGNCTGCTRCDLWKQVTEDVPGSVAAYVRHMHEDLGVRMAFLVPADS